jgi:hypothetical protein
VVSVIVAARPIQMEATHASTGTAVDRMEPSVFVAQQDLLAMLKHAAKTVATACVWRLTSVREAGMEALQGGGDRRGDVSD